MVQCAIVGESELGAPSPNMQNMGRDVTLGWFWGVEVEDEFGRGTIMSRVGVKWKQWNSNLELVGTYRSSCAPRHNKEFQ